MIVRSDEPFDYIVSLTTYPARISMPDVPLVIYSIIRQKTDFRFKLVLVLSKLEFPNAISDVPKPIQQFVNAGLVEIIWTADNLRAYKKIQGPQMKYPNITVMTTDDDILLDESCVDTFIKMHLLNPECILTEEGHPFTNPNEICTGTFRLYPPNSLLKVPDSFFVASFGGIEDDAYTAVLAFLKGTTTKILNTGLAHIMYNNGFCNTAFANTYLQINPETCRTKLLYILSKCK